MYGTAGGRGSLGRGADPDHPPGRQTAINKESIEDAQALAEIISGHSPGAPLEREARKAIEVGKIFKLGTRFTDAIGASYTDAVGAARPALMGCYAIGESTTPRASCRWIRLRVRSPDLALAKPSPVVPLRATISSGGSTALGQVCHRRRRSVASPLPR